MMVTDFTRQALKVRRDIRDMRAGGWEFIDESGGKLWELQRGWRIDHVITDTKISATGKEIWVKIEKRPSPA